MWITIWTEREKKEQKKKKSKRRGVTDKGSSCSGLNKTRSEEKGREGMKECTEKKGVKIKKFPKNKWVRDKERVKRSVRI